MNKRQIVIDTIDHKRTDKLPYQLFFTRDVMNRLQKEFHDDKWQRTLDNYIGGVDADEFEILKGNRYKDKFGVTWGMDQTGDIGWVDNCLIKPNRLDDYQFPKLNKELIRKRCDWFLRDKDCFRVFNLGFSLFERAWTLRGGMENILRDFIRYPDFSFELLDRICEYNLKVIGIVLEFADNFECVRFGDDWGMQKGLLMGYPQWKQFIRPYLAKMYKQVKDAGLYICQHSCGDNYQLFPDLIDLGLDIYETFQPEVYDVEKVKREFGDKLTFYGGISTQTLLPRSSPDEVKAEVKRMMEIMGHNGGYIVAPTHSITSDISTENILAFIDVVQNQ